MKFKRLLPALAVFAVGVFTEQAQANTWLVDCNAGTITENGTLIQSGLTASNALGLVLGAPSVVATHAAASGDLVEINSICTQDISLITGGLTITNHSGAPTTLDASDGIQGQLEIFEELRVTVGGILLGIASGTYTFSSASDEANVLVIKSGVEIEDCDILNGPGDGLLVVENGYATLLSTTVSGNGTAGVFRGDDGVRVLDASTVELGSTAGTDNVAISGNAGVGVAAVDSSTISMFSATVYGNGLDQVEFASGSSAYITSPSIICSGSLSGSTCTPSTSNTKPAIEFTNSSTAQIQGVAITGSNAAQAILAIASSSVALQGSVVAAAGSSVAAVEASSASAIDIYGGNTICAGTYSSSCSATSGGLAIQIDHIANLLQPPAALLGYTASADAIIGGGLIEEQSNADLGQGASSLSWTVSSANILVQQNSSFRLSGGVTITGNLVLQQGSNGFFNTTDGGGVNDISSVTCNFATVATSHVAGGSSAVSPTVATTTSPAPGSNECMPF